MNNKDCSKFRMDRCKGIEETCYLACLIMADARAAESAEEAKEKPRRGA